MKTTTQKQVKSQRYAESVEDKIAISLFIQADFEKTKAAALKVELDNCLYRIYEGWFGREDCVFSLEELTVKYAKNLYKQLFDEVVGFLLSHPGSDVVVQAYKEHFLEEFSLCNLD